MDSDTTSIPPSSSISNDEIAFPWLELTAELMQEYSIDDSQLGPNLVREWMPDALLKHAINAVVARLDAMQDETTATLANKLGISRATLSRWAPKQGGHKRKLGLKNYLRTLYFLGMGIPGVGKDAYECGCHIGADLLATVRARCLQDSGHSISYWQFFALSRFFRDPDSFHLSRSDQDTLVRHLATIIVETKNTFPTATINSRTLNLNFYSEWQASYLVFNRAMSDLDWELADA